MPVEIVRIDGEHHLHHFARGLLRLLVVFLKCALHMAEIALNSQRCRDELLVRGQAVVGEDEETVTCSLCERRLHCQRRRTG
jgi:hypothetical protein